MAAKHRSQPAKENSTAVSRHPADLKERRLRELDKAYIRHRDQLKRVVASIKQRRTKSPPDSTGNHSA